MSVSLRQWVAGDFEIVASQREGRERWLAARPFPSMKFCEVSTLCRTKKTERPSTLSTRIAGNPQRSLAGMSQIVIDTNVASYLFNWHSLAATYAKVLRGPSWSCPSCLSRNYEWPPSRRPLQRLGEDPSRCSGCGNRQVL